jgi:hypothetical protein
MRSAHRAGSTHASKPAVSINADVASRVGNVDNGGTVPSL